MKGIWSVTLCLLAALAVASAAESREGPVFDLGLSVSHIKYEEPGLMDEKGMMYGLAGDFSWRGGSAIMLGLEARGAWGEVEYSGATWDGVPLTISDIPDYLLEGRGLIGLDVVSTEITLTPFTGLGYRYLNDGLQEKASGGYEREANYFYSPLGGELIADLGDGWFFSARVEYDIFWRGQQVSHFSDVAAEYNDPENDQDKGYGIKGSVRIGKRGGDGEIGFAVEPFVNYWKIEDSETATLTQNGWAVGEVIEPRNESTEFGAALKLIF
jgi:hypothetical protein